MADEPVTGDLALTDPMDEFAAAMSVMSPASGGFALTDPRDTFLGSASATLDPIRLQAMVASTLLRRAGLSMHSLSTLVLLGPATVQTQPFFPRRPERTKASMPEPVRQRVIPPRRVLPEPPKGYDPDWTQNNQEEIIKHLDNTLSATHANQSVLLHSPNGKVFEVTIDEDGNLRATHRQG